MKKAIVNKACKICVFLMAATLAFAGAAEAATQTHGPFTLDVPAEWLVEKTEDNNSIFSSFHAPDNSARLTLGLQRAEGTTLKDIAETFARQMGCDMPAAVDGSYTFVTKTQGGADFVLHIGGDEKSGFYSIGRVGKHPQLDAMMRTIKLTYSSPVEPNPSPPGPPAPPAPPGPPSPPQNPTNKTTLTPPEVRGNTVGNIVNLGSVALQGEWIYYLSSFVGGNSLYKIRTDGSGKQKLNDNLSFYINVVGEWVYYRDPGKEGKGSIYKIRTDGSGKQRLNDEGSHFINVVGEWVYYTGRDNALYKMRTDGSERQKLNDDTSYDINVIGEWVYFRNWSDREKLYKIRTDGSEKQRLNDDKSISVNVVGGWAYYRNESDSGRLYKIRTDGSERQRLNDDSSFDINVAGEWVYYRNWGDGEKLYKIRTDGGGRQRLNDENSSSIKVVGEWVYYENLKDGVYSNYRIRTDGTGRQLVE